MFSFFGCKNAVRPDPSECSCVADESLTHPPTHPPSQLKKLQFNAQSYPMPCPPRSISTDRSRPWLMADSIRMPTRTDDRMAGGERPRREPARWGRRRELLGPCTLQRLPNAASPTLLLRLLVLAALAAVVARGRAPSSSAAPRASSCWSLHSALVAFGTPSLPRCTSSPRASVCRPPRIR